MNPNINNLNTRTEVTRSLANVSIYTYYVRSLKLLEFFISSVLQNVNSVAFKQGELGFKEDGYEGFNCFIDNDGRFIVTSHTDQTFTINVDGELIMEEII